MATEFKMPMLGEVMEEGRIVTWFKKEGDTVERGEKWSPRRLECLRR